jgi:hypothetical protein
MSTFVLAAVSLLRISERPFACLGSRKGGASRHFALEVAL